MESRLAPSARLVKDICTEPNPTELDNFTAVGSALYFTATDVAHGNELWKSDGTPEGTVLVKDIWPGLDSACPQSLINVNGTLFFRARDGSHGWELWKSDGTREGTVLVKDFGLDAESGPSNLTNVNGTLFFTAYEPTYGNELWKSDGTAAGTVLVKDIVPGTDWSFPAYVSPDLTNVNGTLFFRAEDPEHGLELWKSDGTEVGTVLVKDILPGTDSSFICDNWPELTAVNGALFFKAYGPEYGYEIWKSDGTAEGTVVVKDIWPGPNGAFPYFEISALTAVNGTLFFTTLEPWHGDELWKSDGTAEGTALVKEFWRPSESSPSWLTDVNGTLYFTVGAFGADPEHGGELWKSDGTPEGTVLVTDILPGPEDSWPGLLTVIHDTLFFTAEDPDHGRELWKTDGTETGTVLVKDIWPGPDWSEPYYLTDVNGTLFFVASDPAHRELWKSDGAAAGTVAVEYIQTGTIGSYPYSLINVDDTLFFTASDSMHGRELWKSDGTETGTVLVKDINPYSGLSESLSFLTNVEGTLFFAAWDPELGKELWKSDGTAAGTVLVKDIRPGTDGSWPGDLTNVNGTLFFTAEDAAHGIELWKSDGTEVGTVLVKDIWPGLEWSNPSFLTNVNGTLYFMARDAEHGHELWKSDGTEAGTVLVKDINPGWNWSSPGHLTAVRSTLFFTLEDTEHGIELWKSDGTEAGTTLVKDIWPGMPDSMPYSTARYYPNWTDVNGTLFFAARDPDHGMELWKSDGTEAGTVLVKDIYPDTEGSFPYQLTNVHGTLFFGATDPDHGYELWKSDGTEAGTVLVKDIWPGYWGYGLPVNLTDVNGTLYFTASDPAHGQELWKSDGMEAGTYMVQDIYPGTGGGPVYDLTEVNGTLFFAADDGIHGYELMRANLAILDILPNTMKPATVGKGYGLNLSDGTTPYTFAVTTGRLPAGLALSSSGLLHGTPTAGGAFALTITVTDASGDSASRDYTLTVAKPTIGLAPATLARGTYGAAYSQTITASGGTAPYAFTVTTGALPTGLTLTADGRLRGTPALAGTFRFTVSARDSSTGTGPYTASRAYALTVNKAVLTVRADSKSRLYLAANPPLTYTITGFVHGDSLASSGVKGRSVLTTTAARRSPAGGYPIQVHLGTLAARNYAFKLVGTTLTVRKSGWLFWQPGGSANVPVYRIRTGG